MEEKRQPQSMLECVESWLETAKQLGYQVRYGQFDGNGGGMCEFANQKWIFMDVSLSVEEQLEQLEATIPSDPNYPALKRGKAA